ncbi:hypothetical protein BDQ12DRAFT_258783 [Crucibulum laeve]|uniref:Uncharacterized protein n=1 Tax=Crucibulum laeve TaxID=68775 RepID=A0A5C3LT46_9AGAR|nr:hypothetical protein BDQ12DRAFT_258783 [Crucibulum laeve]
MSPLRRIWARFSKYNRMSLYLFSAFGVLCAHIDIFLSLYDPRLVHCSYLIGILRAYTWVSDHTIRNYWMENNAALKYQRFESGLVVAGHSVAFSYSLSYSIYN